MRSSSGDGDPVFVLLTLELVTWNVWAEALCGWLAILNKRPAFPRQRAPLPQPWRCPAEQSLPGPRLSPRGSRGTRMCWHSPQAPAGEQGSSPALRPSGRRPGCCHEERLSHGTDGVGGPGAQGAEGAVGPGVLNLDEARAASVQGQQPVQCCLFTTIS